MYEKRLPAVSIRAFTSDGGTLGRILTTQAQDFKVKQQVILNSNTAGQSRLEVKRVESATVLYVGPISTPITARSDISNYLVADSASIQADEQPRPTIPEQEIERLTYEEEPTVARRTVLVDALGNKYSDTNPLPVQVDGDINVGDINVRLSHLDNVPNPGDIADSVRVGDGTDLLGINADGSINVVDDALADLVTETNNLITDSNTLLDDINTQLTSGTIKVDDDQTQTALNNILGQLQAGGIIIGTENGTPTGVQHVFVNNIKEMILKAKDRTGTIVYADFGTKDQRITKITYTAPSIGTGAGFTAEKTFTYTQVGNRYRRDTPGNWSLV
jgi:hypothetical protein